MKTKPTVYTYEKRDKMRENAKKIPVYREKAAAACKRADYYATHIDRLYDMVVAEGLPRYYFIGTQKDPDRVLCRYCGVDIGKAYGLYSWRTNPLDREWKIQCPACERFFPSNDFGKYYKLGLDERGIFRPELAKEKNAELVAKSEAGYLKNLLYPEKDVNGVTDWGVDDGFGYFTGASDKNGRAEKHTYIAYYLHWGLWYGGEPGGVLTNAVSALTDAYLYTGDIAYARAGIKLLDRIADFYPDFDWYRWHYFRGDTFRGHILDVVWSNFLITFCLAYDAFFPAYDDPEVIGFLREKSLLYNQKNPKDTAEAIRRNAEEGLLMATFNAAKESKLAGNFGLDQRSVATAACVYDTMPETGEWLDWIMASGSSCGIGVNPPERTGGNITAQLINAVCRDGLGNESSPDYNALWSGGILPVAELLHGYGAYPGVDLYKNPKFIQMLYAHLPLALADYYTVQIGDSGEAANPGFVRNRDDVDFYMTAYRRTGDPVFAQYLYMINGRSADGLTEGPDVSEPEKIRDDVKKIIAEHGEFKPLSGMLTGYGFAVLRDGERTDTRNTLRDFWMYFGRSSGHGHGDSLNLGFDAFGLNMAPELGYPKDNFTEPNTVQWSTAAISHNTVTVDNKVQLDSQCHSETRRTAERGFPLHFDDSGMIKLMEIDQSAAYAQTDIYRRAVVMIETDESAAYGVDFFRVKGGDDHLYSFHAQSDEIFETEGVTFKPQTDKNGAFVGTYASPDVPWGPDPDTDDTKWEPDGLRYPAGHTWLDNVRRAAAPDGCFAVDFLVKDFHGVLPDSEGLHLRMTQVNGFGLSEVVITRGMPPPKPNNPESFEYVIARRNGENLDSLFVTVFEPYKGERCLSDIKSVPAEYTGGAADGAAVCAVKITHVSGRTDYICYASDNTSLCRIDDTFDFRGFIGVMITTPDGTVVRRYVNDGDIIGQETKMPGALTGTVLSFTETLASENFITVSFDTPADVSALPGAYIYIDNDGVQNGVYKIERATPDAGGAVRLSIGRVTLIRRLINDFDFDSGYEYNIAKGQMFKIPLPWEWRKT